MCFLTSLFLGAYGIFMGPAVSIMICEYFCISRGNVFVRSMYMGNSTNPNYWYTRGWNVQAYTAYIVSVGLCFVGFVNRVGAKVPDAGVKLGYLGWFLTFPTGFIVYFVVTLLWPHQNVANVRGLLFEQLADDYDDNDADDDDRGPVLEGIPAAADEGSSTTSTKGKGQAVIKAANTLEE